jgi:predicted CopG family antitoxin
MGPFKKGKIYLLTILTLFIMLATKRIPVTEAVWVELSDLKVAGQTYSQLLEEMIEDRKKARFFRDMERIEEDGEFVEFPW